MTRVKKTTTYCCKTKCIICNDISCCFGKCRPVKMVTRPYDLIIEIFLEVANVRNRRHSCLFLFSEPSSRLTTSLLESAWLIEHRMRFHKSFSPSPNLFILLKRSHFLILNILSDDFAAGRTFPSSIFQAWFVPSELCVPGGLCSFPQEGHFKAT